MLAKLKALLTGATAADADPQRQLQLAATALLIEVAQADHSSDERELQAVRQAARATFDLDESALDELLAEAHVSHDDATSLYEFTSLINEHFSPAQKFALVRCLWQVAHADGHLDRYEDHRIRRIAELIYVPHSEFIQAKLAVVGNG